MRIITTSVLLLSLLGATHTATASPCSDKIDALEKKLNSNGAARPDDGLSLALLSARADQALYKAKRAGRGQIAFYSSPEDAGISGAKASA